MKLAILAGGRGSRLGPITESKPKALVEIGGKPILWHIMKYYAQYGFKEFVIAIGYNKETFTISALTEEQNYSEQEWTIKFVDTGVGTQTGGRIKRLASIMEGETFMLAWCDGLFDINLHELLSFHTAHNKLVTMTAVHPPSRFGHLTLDGNRVARFSEKPVLTDKWINGGLFVIEPGALDYIEGDETQWEKGPLQRLVEEDELMAYRHRSFWQCMDTMHDKQVLEDIWKADNAPWKVWS